MNLEQAVIEELRELPQERQQEVLDFAKLLRQKISKKVSRRSLKGLCAEYNIKITENDIEEARREMWNNFPRKDI